jgi:hypothetical protein
MPPDWAPRKKEYEFFAPDLGMGLNLPGKQGTN